MSDEQHRLEPAQVVQRLDALAGGLDKLGGELAEIDKQLEAVSAEYDRFVENFKAGLWRRHVDGDLKRLPPEDIRLALAHKDMPTGLLGSYTQLRLRRDRAQQAIRRTQSQVDSYRSILSAQKEGLV